MRPPQRVMPGHSLFGSMSSMFGAKTYEVDPEDGDPVLQNIKKEKETMPFQSPPHTGRVFGSGWERLSSDAFTKVSSSKKSKAKPGSHLQRRQLILPHRCRYISFQLYYFMK